MTKIKFLLLLIFAWGHLLVSGQFYGLKFSGIDYSLDQRTGLNLTPKQALDFNDDIDLSFNLLFESYEDPNFGHVFRMVLGNQNIDLVHRNIPGESNNFEVVIGKRTSKITFHIPGEKLTEDWNKLYFNFNFKEKRMTFRLNDQVFEDELSGFDGAKDFRLMFGAHEYEKFASTDVPDMIIRDVVYSSNENKIYYWPLNETQGNIANSIPEGSNGEVSNPGWLLKHLNSWENVLNKKIQGLVKSAFDPVNEELYLVAKDSIYILNVKENSFRYLPQNPQLYLVNSNEVIYDAASSKLLLYSLDNNYVSAFDPENNRWTSFDASGDTLTAYWHHNAQIFPDGSLYGFGGYGWYQYKNSVLKWNAEEAGFDSVKYEGDFSPRYLAASGYNPADSLMYLIGGYGSESGKQSETPDYYHEILAFSPMDSSFNRVFEFQNQESGFCFANSLVFDDAGNMYGLYFPKYQFNNKLQLVQISLEEPGVIEVGDAIPYSFLDIDSYADLYYSSDSKLFLALTTYYSQGNTSIALHTIGYPPQPFSSTPTADAIRIPFWLVYTLLILVVLLSAYYLYKRRKGKVEVTRETMSVPVVQEKRKQANSIILFGGFQIIDRDGNDITGQFTTLPKKLFLFILLHSLRNDVGVSSNTLYETFWFDKSIESARNNRAVNIVKLKSLLDKLESAGISKETGYWKFDFDPLKIHIDFYHYLQLKRINMNLNKDQVVHLLSITDNSPFLKNTNAEWLDPYKSEVSNDIIDMLLRYIEGSNDDPDFLLHIVNSIFICDPVSEEGLKVQCKLLIKQGKHSLAKKAYARFASEFKQLYDEEFDKSFHQLSEEI